VRARARARAGGSACHCRLMPVTATHWRRPRPSFRMSTTARTACSCDMRRIALSPPLMIGCRLPCSPPPALLLPLPPSVHLPKPPKAEPSSLAEPPLLCSLPGAPPLPWPVNPAAPVPSVGDPERADQRLLGLVRALGDVKPLEPRPLALRPAARHTGGPGELELACRGEREPAPRALAARCGR
jgi:hypothetical protein